MLTYRLIDKKNNICTYQYFPFGKDIKVEGGLVEFDLDSRTNKLVKPAQLDRIKTIDKAEYFQMLDHINELRKENDFPLLEKPEISGDHYQYYEFADQLINEINRQILEGNLKEKGFVI